MTFPLCSSFLPTIVEDQLCYKLTLNKTSGQGKRNELLLLLDYNKERSLQTSSDESNDVQFSKETLNFDTSMESIQGVSAKIQINTISPFIGFGGGIYTMTDVKRMTATDDFLKMLLKERNCEVELYEDCRWRSVTVFLGKFLAIRYSQNQTSGAAWGSSSRGEMRLCWGTECQPTLMLLLTG